MDRRAIDRYIKFDRASGKFVPEESRRYILPFHAYFDLSDVEGGYVLPAVGTPARLVCWKQPYSSINGMDANLGTPLQIKNLVLSDSSTYDTASYLVELNEIGESRKFMNKPVHIRSIFGSAKYPGRMCEPYMFASQHQIQAQFTPLNAAARTIRPYVTGAQYYPWAAQSDESRAKLSKMIKLWNMRRKQVWPFWLTTDESISLAVNEERSFEMLPGQDAQFVACFFTAVSTGNFEYSLLEVKTQQSLTNGRATFTNSLGDARLPKLLSKPYVVPAGYRLRLTVKNLFAGTNNIYFTIAGKKVYAPLTDSNEKGCDTRYLDLTQE
jgi:hypothetical protein